MSTRDELAATISGTRHMRALHLEVPADIIKHVSDGITDAILAAGYRKPRVITTDEELDTLPEGTSILDQAEKLTLEETSMECLEWVDRHGNACWVELPATVLHEGEAKP